MKKIWNDPPQQMSWRTQLIGHYSMRNVGCYNNNNERKFTIMIQQQYQIVVNKTYTFYFAEICTDVTILIAFLFLYVIKKF